ncbi:MAG TPA: rod shape-determining protein MreD [Rhizomicrobium sp.]|nr:rod shape-determining protein MreD [Rhizomicrobium sp.]
MFDRLDISFSRSFAAVIPFGFAILGVILSNAPVSLLRGAVPPPMFSLMPIYFWCLVRPDLMPAWIAFFIGMMEDFFSGGPPGIWTLSYVVTYALVDRERDAFAGLSGLGAILGFAAAMLVATVCGWLVAAFVYGRLPPLSVLSMQFAMSVLFYVPVAMILGRVHRKFVGPLRSDF